MELEKYIGELLYNHECVIVPDFGAFIANPLNATINPITNKFSPPSKQIGFNQSLKKGDGLLVNLVSEKLQISYDDAKELVLRHVDGWRSELGTKHTLTVLNLGVFFLDSNEKLHFEASTKVNYLLDSYGLAAFNLIPIDRKTAVVEETTKPEPKVRVLQPPNSIATETHWKKIAIAAALIPFASYLVWLSVSTELFRGNQFTYADLNPFQEKICATYKLRKKIVGENTGGLLPLFDFNTDNGIVQFSLFDRSEKYFDAKKMIVARLESMEAKPISTAVTKPAIKANGQYRFHVVGGCFGVYKNAEKLMNKLRKKGFNAAIIDKNNGLYRVAFQSYTTESEAEKGLAQIKSTQNKDAWILVK